MRRSATPRLMRRTTLPSRPPGRDVPRWPLPDLQHRCAEVVPDRPEASEPKWAPALLGTALATRDDNRRKRSPRRARKALEINPALTGAHLFIASEAADAGHRRKARKAIQNA